MLGFASELELRNKALPISGFVVKLVHKSENLSKPGCLERRLGI
ncbi:hypothetical protein BTN50_1054 [Candidatus Enterovibrio altilux]|uniref:Uncharacterized protein n=1 Tax=Candidatus Enterovibrio altilux TaxID=1927128 RepID=A0A291B978_9GAMM|nr:hypothetical protein BTN50_1054 [Candidatus Enterovibrio luxaltus]